MNQSKVLLLSGVASALCTLSALGQVTSDVVTGSDINNPPEFLLYSTSPASEANRAPVGNAIWFVSDGGAAGVPTGAVNKQDIDAIAGGTAQDHLFASAQVDGLGTIVDAPGRFLQFDVTYPLSDQGKPVYAYLWSDSTPGDVGDTFGLLEMTTGNGRIVPPGGGIANFEFHMNSEIFADTYSVVPEPASSAAVASLLCLAGAGARIMRRRRTA